MLQKNANPRGIFSHRDLRLALPARALSFFGDSIALVVLSLAIAESEQPARMTVLLIAFSLPMFALAPLAGRIVDEYDSRAVLVLGGTVQVAASLGLVLSDGFAAMITFVLLLQAGQAVTGPSWSALVPRIVGDELVGKAIGVQQSMSAVAGLAGAAAGGVLYDAVGYHRTLLLDTATFALLIVVAAMVGTRRGRRYDAQQGAARPAAAQETVNQGGWATIRRDDLLRLLVPALWLFIIAAEAPNVVEIFLIRDELHATPASYGMVMAGFMLGTIAGPLLSGRVGTDPGRVSWAAAAAATIGVLMMLVGTSSAVWTVALLFVAIGVAGGALNGLLGTLIVTRPADHLRGRVIASFQGTARGFSIVALVMGGLGGQVLGVRTTFVVCGALSLAVALIISRTRSAAEIAEVAVPAIPATM